MAPALSVFMCTSNSGAFVESAIASILAQTFSDFELIVVDEGSTDGTIDIIHRQASRDRRIIVAAPPPGLSYSARANVAVSMAAAPLVARMDSDDIAFPRRFETQISWMRERNLDICGTHAEEFGLGHDLRSFPETHAGIEREHLFRVALCHPSLVARTSVLRRWPYREMAYDDYDLWTRLLSHCRFGNVPQVLLRYRRHDRQVHVLHAREGAREMQRGRFSHFYRLYPGTVLADYLPVSRMADRLPMTSLDELERAGGWLVRLAEPCDYWLRVSLLRRWHQTCAASRSLGPGVDCLHDAFAATLQAAIDITGPAS